MPRISGSIFLRNVVKLLQDSWHQMSKDSFTSIWVFMKSQNRNLKHAARERHAGRKFISFGLLADIFPIKGCIPAQFRKTLEFKFVTSFVLESVVILRRYSLTLLNKEITNNEVSNSVIKISFYFVVQIWNIFNCAFNSNWNIYRISEVSGIWRYVFGYV